MHATPRIIFESPAFKIEQTASGRVHVWPYGQHCAWQPPPIEAESFLERLSAVRADDPWQDQRNVHAFLNEEMEKG